MDVLSGKVNPSGKMPFTTPVSLDQSPAHALGNFPGRDLKVNYEEDILVGYRWFDTKGLPVVIRSVTAYPIRHSTIPT